MSLEPAPHRPVFAVSRWDLCKVLMVLAVLFALMLLHNRGGTSAGADAGADRLTSRPRPAAPAVTPLAGRRVHSDRGRASAAGSPCRTAPSSL